jgi:hypothetical protein
MDFEKLIEESKREDKANFQKIYPDDLFHFYWDKLPRGHIEIFEFKKTEAFTPVSKYLII